MNVSSSSNLSYRAVIFADKFCKQYMSIFDLLYTNVGCSIMFNAGNSNDTPVLNLKKNFFKLNLIQNIFPDHMKLKSIWLSFCYITKIF